MPLVRLQSKLYAWICAFRPPAQINLSLPLLMGMVQATPCQTPLGDLPWLQVVILSLLLQAMILFSNEASDADTDDLAARTAISGGAGVGAAGMLSSRVLRRAAILSGGLGLVAIAGLGSSALAAVWLTAMALVWAYDGRTLRLSRHPAGALCQAVGVGVLLPLLGAWSVVPVFWPDGQNLAIGLCLGLSGHMLTALPDEHADRKVGKITVVVCLGAAASLAVLLLGLSVAGMLLLGLPAPKPCSAGDAISWPLRLAAMSSLALVLGLAWRLRGRPAAGRLTLDIWLAGGSALALWGIWMVR